MNPFMFGFLDELQKRAEYKAMPLSSDERAAAKKRYAQAKPRMGSGDGCSPGKTKEGYDFHTHRARTKSYPSFDKIPIDRIRFVGSTA